MDERAKKQVKDWREARRERAWELKQKGWKQQAIAEALGVSAGAVSQWMTRVQEKGPEALRRQPRKGAIPCDERAIERWRTDTWVRVKKAEQEGRTIVFVDEAEFYLLPMVVHPYAPW